MQSSSRRSISVDITIPVYNEQDVLKKNVQTLHKKIQTKQFSGYKISITIANNASTDQTLKIAKNLSIKYPSIKFLDIKKKGRGRALRSSWKKNPAEIVAYTDVDLSADLNFLKPLIDSVATKDFDIAIGSRLKEGAQVSQRTILREIMSQSYNFLIQKLFNVEFKDAQCGFKAISKKAFIKLEPLIKNQNWFFDSEMLIIAHQLNMKISEIPVQWTDDTSSTVKVAKTAFEDLKGLWRLKKTKPWKNT